jgi:hypothetical protein
VQDALFDFGWRRAMEMKIEALNENGIWELVTLAPGKQTIGYKCLYTIKFNQDGSIERLKGF